MRDYAWARIVFAAAEPVLVKELAPVMHLLQAGDARFRFRFRVPADSGSGEPQSKPGCMKVSKGKFQPELVAAIFLIFHVVLSRPFSYRVYVVLRQCPRLGRVREVIKFWGVCLALCRGNQLTKTVGGH